MHALVLNLKKKVEPALTALSNISITVQGLNPKLNPCQVHRHVTLTKPTHFQASNSQHSQSSYTCLHRAQAAFFNCHKPTLYKVRVVFSKPVHADRVRGDPFGPNHGPLTAKPSSHHVHVTWPTLITVNYTLLLSNCVAILTSSLFPRPLPAFHIACSTEKQKMWVVLKVQRR